MSKNTLRILLSSNSGDSTEQINHLFRNAGHAAQTHRITSLEDLQQCLNDETWDVALCEQSNDEVDMHSVLETVTETNNDTPVIFLVDEPDAEIVAESLRRGAMDVIETENQDHLLYASNREIKNAKIRRRNTELEQSLSEVSDRFDTLMAQADDAVAYVLDGMHVDVNEAYAEAFAYKELDDFLAVPMMDLVAEADQDKYKSFTRKYNEESEQELELNCVTADGAEFPAVMRFAPAMFDGEKCTQVIVQREVEQQEESSAPNSIEARIAAAASADANTSTSAPEPESASPAAAPHNVDPITGLQTRYGMMEELDEFLKVGDQRGSLLYISINDFAQLKSRLGLSGGHHIRQEVAAVISENFESQANAHLSHYGEDSFVILLPELAVADGASSARKLCQLVDKTMFEFDEQSVQCHCCVGVVDISAAEFKDSNEAMDSAFITLEKAKAGFIDDDIESGVEVLQEVSEEITGTLFDVAELVKEDRLKMLFQPVISLHGEPMECYEATLRLLDEEGEEMGVDVLFQSVNQRSGDTSLDKWLVVEGTKVLKNERDQDKPTNLILNLSQNALLDEEFGKWIAVAMKAAELPPSSIILQFDESTVTHYLKQAIRFHEKMSEWNFRFGLKHVGQNADAWKNMKHFQPDFVFLHAEFTHKLQSNSTDTKDLHALLLRLARFEGTYSILPFVSTAATMASLWQLNVHYIQGEYLQARTESMDYEFSDPDEE